MLEALRLSLVEMVRTLALAAMVGGGLGWLVWWHHQHGPDK